MIYKNADLHNVSELIPDPDGPGQSLSRIPNALRLKLNDAARNNTCQAAGCEIRFNLKGDTAALTLQAEPPNQFGVTHPVAEVFQGDMQVSSHPIGPEPTTIQVTRAAYTETLHQIAQTHGMLFDPDLFRIVLPYRPAVNLLAFEGDVVPPAPDQVPATRLLTYGSSITHGHLSVRPTESWAMQTAHALGVDLINLGFGGGAHLEPEMADYIAQRDDWNFATLEMGINMVGGFPAEAFAKRVDYFVERVATAHPDKWIFCIDMFTFLAPERLQDEEQKQFRRIVSEKVSALDQPRLVHVSGLEMLPDPRGLTTDLVHPSPAGMSMIANNVVEVIRERIRE